jgi:Phage integrase family
MQRTARASIALGHYETVEGQVKTTLGFHAFRHTCASMLFADGRNVKQVQEWLGHATPTITLDVYVHLLDEGVGEALGLGGGSGMATGHPVTAANGRSPERRVPPPELLGGRARAGQILDELRPARRAVVGPPPGRELTRSVGEREVGEDPLRRPAQRRRPAQPPRQRQPHLRPGDPHRRLTHVAGERAHEERRTGAERAGDGAVAAV